MKTMQEQTAQPKKLSGNFITITAGYQHNEFIVKYSFQASLCVFCRLLVAAASIDPQNQGNLLWQVHLQNVCFGMTTFKPNEFEFDS